jgi:hypothetical protein
MKVKNGSLAAILLLLVLLLTIPTQSFALQVTLSWDASIDAPYIISYKVYYGEESGIYTTDIDVGNTTSYTIYGLTEGQTYYFAVTAKDNRLLEGDYSDEVGYNSTYYPVFRFWSDTYRHHFFTASEAEKNSIIATVPTNVWRYEGIAFYAFVVPQSNTVPVHRFWSDLYRGHFYTASEAEKNSIIATVRTNIWRYEGIAFYAFVVPQPNSVPVFRFWSNLYKGHFFTASEAEKNYIIATYSINVWKYEGIAFYVPTL